jgi:hypothetical protein
LRGHKFEADADSDTHFRFVVEDSKYNYLSGRFPPDAELLAKKAVAMVNEVTKTT